MHALLAHMLKLDDTEKIGVAPTSARVACEFTRHPIKKTRGLNLTVVTFFK